LCQKLSLGPSSRKNHKCDKKPSRRKKSLNFPGPEVEKVPGHLFVLGKLSLRFCHQKERALGKPQKKKKKLREGGTVGLKKNPCDCLKLSVSRTGWSGGRKKLRGPLTRERFGQLERRLNHPKDPEERSKGRKRHKGEKNVPSVPRSGSLQPRTRET